MNILHVPLLRVALATIAAAWLTFGADAGTFKRITIDGSFGDWAGVPVAYADSSESAAGADFRQVYLANDEQYLYVRFTLYAPNSPFTSHNNIFVDTDNDPGTGFHPLGLAFGSELLIQSGTGYQEKNGAFNEGAINGLDWAAAPPENASEFEIRIARAATFSTDGLPVFMADTIALLLESENTSFVLVDLAPDSGERLPYTWATAPEPFVGRRELVSLTGTSWRLSITGSDPGTDWSQPSFDDTQAGWSTGSGLFGFSPAPDLYPAPIATPFPSGSAIAYLRTRFDWTNDPAGIVLVSSNYLSDGAIFYLNGIEARRIRLPSGNVQFDTPATGGPAVPGAAELVGLPASSLVVGENVLAVEIHQSAGNSSDLILGLSLTAASQFPVVFTDPAQPADRTVVAGQPTTFAAEIVGSAPLTYQWFKDGLPLSGATDATLTLDPVLAANAGAYQLKVSNPLSTEQASRVATLTVAGTPVSITDPAQPADQTVMEGGTVTFAVVAAGSAPLSYQWFKGPTPIDGATDRSYTLPFVRSSDAGNYRVEVSNPLPSSATSRTARLSVTPDQSGPSILNVSASSTQVVLTLSEPVDEISARQIANYSLGGGLQVNAAARSATNPAEIVLTTSPQTFGTLHCVTVNGVRDLFNNPIRPDSTTPFVSSIAIDGSFDDWATVPLALADAVDSTTASDYQSIYVTNDARFIFIRVTLHAPSDLAIFYNNIFVDGDNSSSGYPFRIGSEMLIQGGSGYQQKNGGFNEGGINGLDWAIQPAGVSTDFEFRISRQATYANDGLPVFTAPAVGLVFDAENTSFQTVDTAPDSGGLLYTLFDAPDVALKRLTLEPDEIGDLILRWSSPGVLQFRASLTSGQWENVDENSGQLIIDPRGSHGFYRLYLPCP